MAAHQAGTKLESSTIAQVSPTLCDLKGREWEGECMASIQSYYAAATQTKVVYAY